MRKSGGTLTSAFFFPVESNVLFSANPFSAPVEDMKNDLSVSAFPEGGGYSGI